VRVILDTNVFVSGVFFTGPPSRILDAWNKGNLQLVISQEILEEYQRVGEVLSGPFPGVRLEPILGLLTIGAELLSVEHLPEPVCQGPDDDKFLACALAGECNVIVSGDKHLLKVSGFQGIHVAKPRIFVDEYLTRGL